MTSDQAVIWPSRPAWTRDELLAALRNALKGRVERAWLIGSHARGTADGDSDVDLILVHSTTLSWPDRANEFEDFWDRFGDVDMLIYTPEEWVRMERNPSGFIELARQTWVRLI
jgi:predicted nucleotidyltransferase